MRKKESDRQELWCGKNLKSDTPRKKVCLVCIGTPDTPKFYLTHKKDTLF